MIAQYILLCSIVSFQSFLYFPLLLAFLAVAFPFPFLYPVSIPSGSHRFRLITIQPVETRPHIRIPYHPSRYTISLLVP